MPSTIRMFEGDRDVGFRDIAEVISSLLVESSSRIVDDGDSVFGQNHPSEVVRHDGIEAGYRRHHENSGRRADERSGGDGRADQSLAAYDPLLRCGRADLESQARRSARRSSVGEGRHRSTGQRANCTTLRPTRARPTSRSSTPPTPAKPPTTGTAGKTSKANPDRGPQRLRGKQLSR